MKVAAKHRAGRRAAKQGLKAGSRRKAQGRFAPRRMRRRACTLGALTMCSLLPVGGLELAIYRSNLAIADEPFPSAPNFGHNDRLLVVSPHCDDETLGAGGTIAAARRSGAAVRVVFLTNGDGSRSTKIAEDARHLHPQTYPQLAVLRQSEATRALAELGVGSADIVFLGYPDGGMRPLWETNWTPAHLYRSRYTGVDRSPYPNSPTLAAPYCGRQVLSDLERAVADFKPTAVFTTHPADTHPDHWAAYAFTSAALEQLRLRPETQVWADKVHLFTFLVHHGLWPAPYGYHENDFLAPPADLTLLDTHWMQKPLSTTSRVAKKAALERYVSQLVFTPQFLRAFLRRNELFGVLPASCAPEAGSGFGVTHEVTLLQNSVHDSVLHDLCPAAAVRSLDLCVSGAEAPTAGAATENATREAGLPASPAAPAAASPTISLHLRLAHSASSRYRYSVALHPLTGDSCQAWQVDVRWLSGRWNGLLRAGEASYPCSAHAEGQWLDVELPAVPVSPATQRGSWLVSASTNFGASRLDQTETGLLRWPAMADAPVDSPFKNWVALAANAPASPHTVSRLPNLANPQAG